MAPAAAISRLRGMSLPAYFNYIQDHASNERVTIAGVSISGAKDRLSASFGSLVASTAAFANVGEFWDHFSSAAHPLRQSAFQAGLQDIADLANDGGTYHELLSEAKRQGSALSLVSSDGPENSDSVMPVLPNQSYNSDDYPSYSTGSAPSDLAQHKADLVTTATSSGLCDRMTNYISQTTGTDMFDTLALLRTDPVAGYEAMDKAAANFSAASAIFFTSDFWHSYRAACQVPKRPISTQ